MTMPVGGLPPRATVTEVGLRDGLQMERQIIPTAQKIALGHKLLDAGIAEIEATAFVSAMAVPQLADAAEVVRALKGHGGRISALVPNVRGCVVALEAGVDAACVFVSASESHNEKNLNCSIERALERIPELASLCRGTAELTAAVATSFGCPFEGDIHSTQVVRVVEKMAESGIRRIGLGDTTGMATPAHVERLCTELAERFPDHEFALHFHNTRGLALANALRGLQLGFTRFEASVGGLGGCPFAPGATGNVATEDLVHMLDEMGIETGVRLDRLLEITQAVEGLLGRRMASALSRAGPRSRLHDKNIAVAATGR